MKTWSAPWICAAVWLVTGSAATADELEAALTLLMERKYETAVSALRSVANRSPESGRTQLWLGRALLEESSEHEFILAEAALRRALKLGVTEARLDIARLHLDRADLWPWSAIGARRGEWEAAESQLEQARLDPSLEAERPRIEFLAARTDFARGDDSAAAQHLQSAVEQARQPLEAFDLETALRARRRAKILRDAPPLDVEILLGLGQFETAAGRAQRLVDSQPESAANRLLLGRTLDGIGRYEEAFQQRRAARLLIEIEATEYDPRLSARDISALYDELETIAPVSPRNPLRKARALLHRNRLTQVIQVCKDFRTRPIPPDLASRLGGEAWFLEGQAHRKAGRNAAALKCYEEAARVAPSFRPQLDHLRRELGPID